MDKTIGRPLHFVILKVEHR